MNPLATIPVVELGGRVLTQSYAILRRFARQLGAYDGRTEEGKYWADAMCDVACDCMSISSVAFRLCAVHRRALVDGGVRAR